MNECLGDGLLDGLERVTGYSGQSGPKTINS